MTKLELNALHVLVFFAALLIGAIVSYFITKKIDEFGPRKQIKLHYLTAAAFFALAYTVHTLEGPYHIGDLVPTAERLIYEVSFWSLMMVGFYNTHLFTIAPLARQVRMKRYSRWKW